MTADFISGKESEGTLRDGFFVQDYPTRMTHRENRFQGRVYILTGPLSYSTATAFPAAAKYFGNATVVGEESGQPLVSNGDPNRSVLPNTKTECISALSRVTLPGGNKDPSRGVLPDIEVVPTLDELLHNSEYLLESTLRSIRDGQLSND